MKKFVSLFVILAMLAAGSVPVWALGAEDMLVYEDFKDISALKEFASGSGNQTGWRLTQGAVTDAVKAAAITATQDGKIRIEQIDKDATQAYEDGKWYTRADGAAPKTSTVDQFITYRLTEFGSGDDTAALTEAYVGFTLTNDSVAENFEHRATVRIYYGRSYLARFDITENAIRERGTSEDPPGAEMLVSDTGQKRGTTYAYIVHVKNGSYDVYRRSITDGKTAYTKIVAHATSYSNQSSAASVDIGCSAGTRDGSIWLLDDVHVYEPGIYKVEEKLESGESGTLDGTVQLITGIAGDETAPKTAMGILAVYDEDLLKATSVTDAASTVIPEAGEVTLKASVPKAQTSGATSARFFIWNSLGGLLPLFDPVDFPVIPAD